MTGPSIARLVSTLKNIPVFAPTAGVHHKAKQRPTVHPRPTNDIPTHSISLAPQDVSLQGVSPQMADITTYEMLDDVNLTIEAAHVTATTHAIAGYVNGTFANWPAIVAKWGKTGKFLLSIDVQCNPSVGAQCLDIESGDATVDQAPAWTKTTAANGKSAKDLRFYPKLYIAEGNAETLVEKMTAAGIARASYLIWTAHYGKGAHICGPSTCGCKVQADATQHTNSDDGVSLDASLCYGYFFSGPTDGAHGGLGGGSVVTASGNVNAPATGAALASGHLATETTPHMHALPSYRGVTLEWAAIAGATSYDVQLLRAGTQVGRTTVTAPKAELPVDPATAYTWRVAALPGGDWSPTSGFHSPAAPATATATETASGTSAAVSVPQPTEEPAEAPTGATTVLVYVQEILDATIAAQLGLPAGTILFIPHTVEGA